MTLLEDLRKELRILQSNVVKSPLRIEDRIRFVRHGSKTLYFPKQTANSYMRAIRILRLKTKNQGKLISDKKLGDLLNDFLFALKYGDESKFMEEIDKHIVSLFDELGRIPSHKHLFIVPIMDLSVARDITIGDTQIVSLNGQTLASLETKHSVKFRFREEDLTQAANEIVKNNETTVYAIVVVDAPDDVKALELAMQKADASLNALRLYNYRAEFVVRDEYRKLLQREIVHINLKTKTHSESHSALNIVANISSIDPDSITRMKNAGLDALNNLLTKFPDELTTLQADILTAILWFGNAVKEEQRNMKFIKSIIALESLLIPDGGQGKGDRISKRYASIMYAEASEHEKKEVFLTMRSLYNVRNSIIHSGEGYVYEDDLVQVMYWTQAAILFLLKYAGKSGELSVLIKNEFPVDENLYAGL